jgi:hypothetical protein
MEDPKIKKEIVAVFMESPFYFTIPLPKRLAFIKFFSQQSVYTNIIDPGSHNRLDKGS